MRGALREAVETIKAAGFSHIKVELEGDIGRDGERECQSCDGEGQSECPTCDGEGALATDQRVGVSYREVWEECDDCYGDGRNDCQACDGSGNEGSFHEEKYCEEYMKEHVPRAVLDRLTYGRFYDDGSVDSEFTFTVPIDNIEDVLVWMKAFSDLANECGSGIDDRGAGLHVSVIPAASEGHYPSRANLDSAGIRNFKSEMTKLLPALFFVASSGHQSRDLQYRHASIGEDKYHAISTHNDTCLEFRVFETCYDNPEAFYDYVKVIANSLKFYADPSLKVKALGKKFGFNDGNTVARFYNTPEQLRILNATIKHLKPRDKTFKKLKEERGVHYTIKKLAQQEKSRMAQLREDYRQYRRNFLAVSARPFTPSETDRIDTMMLHDGMTRQQAEDHVRSRHGKLMTAAQFIEENLVKNYEEVVTV